MRAPDVTAGVVGVGSMGQNHVQVYSELASTDLVGVADADRERARSVAEEYGTSALSQVELLERADVVSIAVPTKYHAPIVRDCIDAGVDVLVEKPFVDDVEVGRELAAYADERDVVLQVGHIERFNPAVSALFDLLSDIEPVAVTANRLGPPLEGRQSGDDVVMDLMIHDIDVLLAMAGSEIASLSATGTEDQRYATAQIAFEDGLVSTLRASRITQRKIRTLEITAEECLVNIDYIDQSVRIHRQSHPEYRRDDGTIRYRHESVTERPMVNTGEPLKRELQSFVEASVNGDEPVVTAEDGIRAIEVAQRIRDEASGKRPEQIEARW
ncbi:Gfo/Idh/MocA family protein [Halopelagius longus]|uniref:Gfo/Idh/MocA family oxidoreductase n=1 Tax=Halopelagius longus TaxID=1236180 RepID=A0A1H1GI80_9EURY|nr:Gfo/Idh/MocA family oxidoreductase [Halopelagius longus]RDI69727.1 gfo/Idh/MocA family oxidoreductase [Halopelagius longus]SDR12891.1 Predicted dehydrogenase [Halopelagius longus]